MRQVRDVLSKYGAGAPKFGGEAMKAPRDERDALRADLNSVRSSNLMFFWICFAALVLVFIFSGFVVVRFLDDPNRISALFAVTGVSVLGLVAQMIKLWKEKVSADLLLVLAGNLKDEDVRGVLEILLRNL